jgi:hypothetical protein
MSKKSLFWHFQARKLNFRKIIRFVCFRARLRFKEKLEKTFWMDKKRKISPKEYFYQKMANFTITFIRISIAI